MTVRRRWLFSILAVALLAGLLTLILIPQAQAQDEDPIDPPVGSLVPAAPTPIPPEPRPADTPDSQDDVAVGSDAPVVQQPRGPRAVLAPPPDNFETTLVTHSFVNFRWAQPTLAPGGYVSGYRIDYRASGSTTWLVGRYIYSEDTLTGTVSGLSGNTGYEFRISSFATLRPGNSYQPGYGAPSGSITATTDAPPAPMVEGLEASGCTPTSITLSWNGIPDVARYQINYRLVGGSSDWRVAGYADHPTSSFTHSGLQMDTGYRYYVVARGDGDPYSVHYVGSAPSIAKDTGDDDCTGDGPVIPPTPPPPTPTPNRAPEFPASESGLRSIAENTGSGVNIGTRIRATDPDGDTLEYSLSGTNAASFDIVESSGQLQTKGSLNYEAKDSYSVTVTATDPAGATGSTTVTINVGNVDEPGSITLSTTEPRVGVPITATLSEPDGIISGISWLWEISSDQSSWSTIARAITSNYQPVIGDLGKWLRVTAFYTDGHSSGKSASSTTSTSVVLPAPSGLAITPLATPIVPENAKREARLSWIGVDDAMVKYVVEARAPTVLSNAWTKLAGDPTCTGTNCTIDFEMDSIIDSKGFADAASYQFQVRATLTTSSGVTISSANSKEIAVRDTPTLSVNGDSRGRSDGKAVVRWSTVPNATKYTVRWRRLPAIPTTDGAPDVSHDYIGWQPQSAASDTAWLGSETVGDRVREYTITGLLLDEIYAVQLNYIYEVSRGVVTVPRNGFSVREAYVWPSARAGAAPGHEGERVATFPLKNPWQSKTYSYIVCEDTFPNGKKADWKKFITHAISQWDLATNGLVDTQRVDGNCANYSTFVDQVVAKVKLFAQSMPLAGAFPTDAEILAYAEYLLDNFKKWRIEPSEMLDEGSNEVLMIDDSSATAVTVAAFAEISRQVGHGWCTPACVSGPDRGVDIRLSRSTFETVDPDVPGVDDIAHAREIPFNSCEPLNADNRYAYGVLVHEAGHALGIRGGLTGVAKTEGGNSHPLINDSVMSYKGSQRVRCSPHPFDVMAIYALYQSR